VGSSKGLNFEADEAALPHHHTGLLEQLLEQRCFIIMLFHGSSYSSSAASCEG
jgi:hypothetical protein